MASTTFESAMARTPEAQGYISIQERRGGRWQRQRHRPQRPRDDAASTVDAFRRHWPRTVSGPIREN